MSNEIKVIIEQNRAISERVQIQTFNYDNIKNKPSINGVELVGDKTTADLGIEIDDSKFATREELDKKADKTEIPDVSNFALKSEIPTKNSQLENDGDFVNSEYVTQGLEGKQDKGDYATREEVAQGLDLKQDKGDYALKDEIPDLTDYVKNTDYATDTTGGVVKINNNYFGIAFNSSKQLYLYKAQELDVTNKLSHYRPIVPSNLDLAVKTGLTTNTLELSDDEKASAKQWLGYATQSDINTAIAGLPQFKISIVQELPETGKKMVLYLVPKDGEAPDVYNEYLWIEDTSSFEFLGSTAVDLTDYVKNTDYATDTVAGVVRVGSYVGTTALNGFLCGNPRTLEQYNSTINQTVIAKGTLENIKDDYVKRGLTENTLEFTDEEKTKARTLIGAGSQADLDTKADDNKVLHLAGSETITGVKAVTLPDNIRFTASKTAGYTPSMTNAQTGLTPATNVPWSRNGWHDHFAFGQSFTIASKEVTTDGESWVADDRDISYLFAQKEYGATGETVLAPNTAEMGFRFVLQSANIAYSNIQWIEIGFAYSSAHTVRLLIESSSNGTEWTEVHNSTTGASATNKFLYVGNLSAGNTYLRISVIKVSTSYLDAITRMLYVKGWTTRKGNQGCGIEYEYPYFWDNIPNLMPVKNGCNLGSTSRRWGTTYTTNLNVGGQILNQTHITKLNNLPTTVVLTQSDYEALATKDANTLYLIEEE